MPWNLLRLVLVSRRYDDIGRKSWRALRAHSLLSEIEALEYKLFPQSICWAVLMKNSFDVPSASPMSSSAMGVDRTHKAQSLCESKLDEMWIASSIPLYQQWRIATRPCRPVLYFGENFKVFRHTRFLVTGIQLSVPVVNFINKLGYVKIQIESKLFDFGLSGWRSWTQPNN